MSARAWPEEQPERRSVEIETAIELLADEYVRMVLRCLADKPRSAPEITDRCAASRVTVYRRLNRLEEAGLVTVETEIDPTGNHHNIYQCCVDELTVALHSHGLDGSVTYSDG